MSRGATSRAQLQVAAKGELLWRVLSHIGRDKTMKFHILPDNLSTIAHEVLRKRILLCDRGETLWKLRRRCFGAWPGKSRRSSDDMSIPPTFKKQPATIPNDASS